MEKNPENLVFKTFSICEYHMDYLDRINANSHSAAVRKSLDTLINQETGKTKKEKIDNLKEPLLIMSIGLIFFLFSFTTPSIVASIGSLALGIFLATFGTITIFTSKAKK